jgi:phosphoglycolate phosphatase-like HAD superfamily hydrolase
MVLTAVLRVGIGDVRAVAVVGDTSYDMLAGRRAGASAVVGCDRGRTTPIR